MEIFTNIALIFVFILIGGVFSAAEMALVSLRDSQVKQLATKGKRGQAVARLTGDPNLFLSAVQIGVTVSGFLSAAFGGAVLSGALAKVLVGWGVPAGAADLLALVLITVAISYFSIVLGELSAKRLAMQRAESFALALGPMVSGIATMVRPVIWFLGKSTDLVVRLVGGDPDASREEVTDEEIRALVMGSATLSDEERQIVDDVFDAGDRTLREVMVPRTEVDFLAGDMAANQAIKAVRGAPHSRYPVTDGSTDKVAGFLHVRDLMDLDGVDRGAPIIDLARPVISLPETVRVLHALSAMRKQRSHMAIVRDEYGGTAGIVTLEDLVEEVIGDITDEYDQTDLLHVDASDIEGLTTLDGFEEKTGYVLPQGPYDTVAGFLMARLGAIPTVGDNVTVTLPAARGAQESEATFTMTVTELDGKRVAWLHIRKELEVGEATKEVE